MYTKIILTNVIQAGAGFGVVLDTGEGCFIPNSVMSKSNAIEGDTIEAAISNNASKDHSDRTPFVVSYIKPMIPAVAESKPAKLGLSSRVDTVAKATLCAKDVDYFVKEVMSEDGIWTVDSMSEEYAYDEKDLSSEDLKLLRDMVSNTLSSMFREGRCARWTQWNNSSDSKATCEWFSCYPRNFTIRFNDAHSEV